MLTRKQNRGGNRGGERRGVAQRGFTLFELLIVVGILALLIAIIVPTLGAVKVKARKTQTLALMSQLASGIDGYFQRFHAYPGPMSAKVTTSASNKLSGTQNMLLGLSYPMVPPSTVLPAPVPAQWTPGALPPPTISAINMTTTASGPVDFASQTPNGNYEQLAPYFQPSAKQTAVVTGALGSNALANFPVVYDAFSDGLPILYFRRSVGVETPVAAMDASTPAGYYVKENAEYTDGTLLSTSGSTYQQGSSSAGKASFGINELAAAASTAGGTATARGGYVLMSAGVDRYYGTYRPYGGSGKNDDMVQVGGD